MIWAITFGDLCIFAAICTLIWTVSQRAARREEQLEAIATYLSLLLRR